MQTLTSIAELDAKIEECDQAGSDAKLREIFGRFCMAPGQTDGDPLSEEYRRAQMQLYEAISGKRYRTENEMTPFDVDGASHTPFPYATESLEVVGTQLLSIGSMLRRMALPRGARILEFGPGWGNTTLAMAQAGYRVTAVDVSTDFCDLIRRRAEKLGVSIDVVNGTFMHAEEVTEPYDAVVFFECFHHCDDHLRLLRALRTALKPEGRIYFGGEPITDAFPVPWGVRLDGESLWAIRKHGWLELGFTEQYFKEALLETGWSVTKHTSGDHFTANVWEAHRSPDKLTFQSTDPKIGTQIGKLIETGISVYGQPAGWAFHGPYCALASGKWKARARLHNGNAGSGTVDVVANGGSSVLASMQVTLPAENGAIEIDFELPRAAQNIEMRFYAEAGAVLTLKSIEFSR